MGATREQLTRRLVEALQTRGWPDVMGMAVAERYTNKSKWTLRRAVKAGQLRLAGMRGRAWCFTKADLNAWLLGAPVDDVDEPTAGGDL